MLPVGYSVVAQSQSQVMQLTFSEPHVVFHGTQIIQHIPAAIHAIQRPSCAHACGQISGLQPALQCCRVLLANM